MASIYEVHFALTSATGGGGGSSQDRFAPKYLVGNTANGDTAATTGTAAGFTYFADPGDGTGIIAALAAAAVVQGDVWIRPGTYTVSSTLSVPDGVLVRGSGRGSTFIQSSDGTISGALIDLGDGASLRDMSVSHNQPVSTKVPEGAGVIQVKDGSASCENVSASSSWDAPSNNTLRACFYAFSTDSLQLKSDLKCFGCFAAFKKNTGSDYNTNLVGFRSADSDLSLVNCFSLAIGSFLDSVTGYNVIAIASQTSGPINIDVRGGEYEANYGCIYVEGKNPATNRMLCSDVTAIGGKDPQGGGSVGIGASGLFNSGIHNCDVTMSDGNGPPCVGFYPSPGNESFNTGRVMGCRLTGGASSYPWYSQSNAGLSGYHTFLGNSYSSTMLAPVTGAQDEAAHNISVP